MGLFRRKITTDEATQVIKEAAETQPISIELTADQAEAILSQWKGDPERPARLTFEIEGRPAIRIPVASCAYWSDTCCAKGLPWIDKGDPPPDLPTRG
jgi:hypothetical protein